MAVDYFLKIDGIPGESTDSKHKGEIEVLSWSWGMTRSESPGGGGGAGGGKVNVQDLSFVSAVSKASPKLLEACAGGQHFKQAVLVARKAGKAQLEFLTYTLSDLLVSSYQTGGGEGAEVVPADQVSLNFSKVQVEYKEQKADGSLGGSTKAGFDVQHNKISP